MPQPLGPTTTTNSPASISRSMPSSAVNCSLFFLSLVGKVLVTSSNTIFAMPGQPFPKPLNSFV